jgi:hypothetical protein
MTQQNAGGTATMNPTDTDTPALTPQATNQLMTARRNAATVNSSDAILCAQLRFGARWSRQQIQDFLGITPASVESCENAWRNGGLEVLRNTTVTYQT